MGKDLNKVMAIGRLGADPEMRYLPDGAAVTTFRVASGRSWKDRDGGQHEETEWFRCVAWDKLAEICNEYLAKGAKVYVEGRLKTRRYTDRDNIERYVTEVVVTDMIMLDGRRDAPPSEEIFDEEDAPVAPPVAAPVAPPSAPAAPPPPRKATASPRTSAPNTPRRNQPKPLDLDDGDIPF